MNMIRFYSPAKYSTFNQAECRTVKGESPRTNIYEQKDGYWLEMIVPGFSKEDIDIKVEDKSLTIFGKKKDQTNDERKIISLSFQQHSFEKRFTITGKLDTEAISASLTNGILTVFLPKREEELAKTAKTIAID